ncbi:MAG TPA: type I-U CRISPR-associated protein Csx17 [Pseudonocardiaceae bacterium]|nr:type I-U CRISPR-associated protein Csx17 [Pseudonocardiaceae bacterium]
MADLVLAGCRTTPLGGYLTSLGLLRAVTRVLDAGATGCWHRQRFVLRSTFATVPELVAALYQRFTPEAIVSPWNGGSGFAGNGKNTTAEAVLHWVRESTDQRWASTRAAAAAADRVVALGRARGWGGQGEQLWDKTRKAQVLALCRAEFPDEALPWLDAAVALGSEQAVAFSRLLGTGGNFGRQELSVTYLTRARAALDGPRGQAWLSSVLTGDETVPYLRDAVGQFDPGRAGGIQSSPWEKRDDKGFVNPWAFLLTIEGTLLFASAMVRRHGSAYAHAALPFQVPGTTGAHDTDAPGEQVLSEIWAPEWSTPLRVDELEHLLGEGRADWRHQPARSGLDFVRAIASLGVDRGIDAFRRHVVVDRLGQNPLAVPADRVEVVARGAVGLLAGLDRWLEAAHRVALPAQVASRVRGLEQALYRHARTGDDDDLVEVIAALGRAHEMVGRSGDARRRVPPLVLADGVPLAAELTRPAEHDAALRIALALASARDPIGDRTPTLSGLRPLLAPVGTTSRRRVEWTDAPAPCPLSAGLVTALAQAARRRAFPAAAPDNDANELVAVRGVRIAFARGPLARASDIHALVHRRVDDDRVGDLLAGLLTIDWTGLHDQMLPGDQADDVPLNLLLPFAATAALQIAAEDGTTWPLLVRPGIEWPAQLIAGHVGDVLADAAHRLRTGGLRHVITPTGAAADGARLAAALLCRPPRRDILAGLHRVAVLPERRTLDPVIDEENPT